MKGDQDNLKPWPTPASPNPTRRPKHTTISGAAQYLLGELVPGDRLGRTNAEMIASVLIAGARRADLRAVRELIAISASQECPNCAYTNQIRQISSEELEAVISAYQSRRSHSSDSKANEECAK